MADESKVVKIRVPVTLMECYRRMAARQCRTMAGQMRLALEQWMEDCSGEETPQEMGWVDSQGRP